MPNKAPIQENGFRSQILHFEADSMSRFSEVHTMSEILEFGIYRFSIMGQSRYEGASTFLIGILPFMATHVESHDGQVPSMAVLALRND